jgi:hypothetical protein
MTKLKPQDIIASATPEVRRLVESILQIERDFQHYQNVDTADLRKDIEAKILKAVDAAASDET